ncbi:Cdc73 family RNA polymerase II accessory factor [Schizosaccharomyces octosporus yFS286]|uniref:Cdc73 family RNA polymerase II accessory factor n=1 Tax=Schizosaccharomyces octosporus (strain yFS286) TaxID=483514 RepID=S9Q663_SCHOY|nr:Cdc73 family RNA polymerase II accessory factor [Schizosaccharomyces octosporus yFS286]EPX75103.1 Cdc73 family RNA polymerase II accessory factor [Schizosaccharomyces octosporus yFS286]
MEELDALLGLKNTISKNEKPKLLASENTNSEVENLSDAKFVAFTESPKPFSLDENTKFIKLETNEPFTLRSIYFAWLLRDSSIADYIQQCSEYGIRNLTFLERTDLISWLEGSAESEHIVGLEAKQTEKAEVPTREQKVGEKSDQVKWLQNNSRVVSNHNTILHGAKPTNFLSLRKDVLDYIHMNKSSHGPAAEDADKSAKRRNRDPIILLSPSASSLLTMHNVKKFLEEGIFVPPLEAAQAAGGGRGSELVTVNHRSSKSNFGTMRFIVVDNTENFKPDYWSRVVCVFTTGQAWQFRDYKWSEPHQLFHHVKGFLVQYVGDAPHPATRDWNVEGVFVERVRRHTDREVVSQLWDKLERWMENRWPLLTGNRR